MIDLSTLFANLKTPDKLAQDPTNPPVDAL
jgi:hypothetical protein